MLHVDFREEEGEIRRINGVNLGPKLHGNRNVDMNTPFKALNVPISRFHDAPLDNPGTRLIDPNLIFANFHADPEDSRNYYFRQTDDYLRNFRDLGVDLHYRLGPSIEHSIEHYFIYPPEDFEKWIEICTNIIRHYNEGWNNGFAWDIKYWTIWEEACQRRLWDGEAIQFYRLFKLAVKRLKERFPNIKLGTEVNKSLPPEWGDSFPHWRDETKWVADFLAYCRDENVPMDFFACSLYKGDLDEVIGYPEKLRAMLDSYGFCDTEIHIAEWNYTNPEIGFSGKRANESPEGCYGPDGAAFAAAVLTGWQDTPLTMANYYTAGIMMGLFDQYAVPKKVYYGMLAFGEIVEYNQRVESISDQSNVKVLAGVNGDGEGGVLVSAFKSEETSLELRINGASTTELEVRRVDIDLNLEPVEVKSETDCLVLEKKPGSTVFLIEGLKVHGA